MTTHRHVAVIPSLRRDPDQLLALTTGLQQAGVETRLVVTGGRLDATLTERGIEHLSPRANPGFAAAIHWGADQGEWDWLYIVNDDITVGDDFAEVVSALDTRDPQGLLLQFIDPEPRRPIPDLLGVFTSVSLLDGLVARLGLTRHRLRAGQPWYKSFSFVAVSRGLWEALGGLDTHLPYTYEDADFSARAQQLRADILDTPGSRAEHDGSSTSRRHIGRVLPVACVSATRYLVRRGSRPALARLVVTVALLVRMLLVPLNSAAKADHARAILRSLRAVNGGPEPHLPPYEES